jgi:hypothetical protein
VFTNHYWAGGVEKLLEVYGETAKAFKVESRDPPEAAGRVRCRYHPLPSFFLNPLLRVDEEAARALEELRELNPVERVSEMTEGMRRAVEELERRLGGKAAR